MLIHLETCVRYIFKPRTREETNPDEQSVNSVSLWRWRGHILRDSRRQHASVRPEPTKALSPLSDGHVALFY